MHLLNEKGSIELNYYIDEDMRYREKDNRHYFDIRSLFKTEISTNPLLYTFYKGVCRKNDMVFFLVSKIRYDIILIHPGTIGEEYYKTSGHIHVGDYPEIYEVINGTALFLLQKEDNKGIVQKMVAYRCTKGGRVYIPPGYAHVSINIANEPLVFCDLVSTVCANSYASLQEKNGLAYRVLKGKHNIIFEKNEAYMDCLFPDVQIAEVTEIPLYEEFLQFPEYFDFLQGNQAL